MIISLACFADKARTVNPGHEPISDVQIIFLNADNDTIGTSTSDINGNFEYNEEVGYIIFRHPEYQEMKSDVRRDRDGIFILKPIKQLEEFIVTAETAKQFLTHDSYVISRQAMKKYLNSLHALNEIPFISVSNDGNLKYKGNGNVKMLINGVESSASEIASLSKDDISKVNVYSIPPAEFAAKNVEAVIDIILKENITGGNGSIQTKNSINRVFGDNNASLFYNYKRSRFSAFINNHYYRGWGQYNNEHLSYTFRDIEYDKFKIGKGGKSHDNENSATIAFQNGLANNYLINVSLSGHINRISSEISQRVTSSDGSIFNAKSLSNTPSQSLTAAVSFRKYFNEGKKGYLYAAFYYSALSGKNYSSYTEIPSHDQDYPENPFSGITSIHQRTSGVYGKLDYVRPIGNWGQYSADIYNTYSTYRQPDDTPDYFTSENTLYGYGTFFAAYRKFRFYVLGGLTYIRTSTPHIGLKENKVAPVINSTLYYNPSRALGFQLSYVYGVNNASLAQRTATPQWRDNFYVYQGNPDLRSYDGHKLSLNGSYTNKYFEISANLIYNTTPGYIGTMFVYTDDYILETLVNQKKYQTLSADIWARIYPLGKRIWSVSGYARVGRVWGKNEIYSYIGKNSHYTVSSSVNLNKWNFGGFVQLQGDKFNGISTRTRPFYYTIYGYYRPIENLNIGISWECPFLKEIKEKEWTIPQSPVKMNNIYTTKGAGYTNKIYIEINYYFNYGRHRNNFENVYTGSQAESGVLRR